MALSAWDAIGLWRSITTTTILLGPTSITALASFISFSFISVLLGTVPFMKCHTNTTVKDLWCNSVIVSCNNTRTEIEVTFSTPKLCPPNHHWRNLVNHHTQIQSASLSTRPAHLLHNNYCPYLKVISTLYFVHCHPCQVKNGIGNPMACDCTVKDFHKKMQDDAPIPHCCQLSWLFWHEIERYELRSIGKNHVMTEAAWNRVSLDGFAKLANITSNIIQLANG